jgi:hypothetical protein
MWARGGRKAAGALVSAGLTQKAAEAVVWAVKLAILVGFLFVAFWLALLVGFVYLVVTGKTQPQDDTAEAEEVLDMVPLDMTKLRQKIWYDPLPFNDYEDSRFEMDE